VNTDNLFSNGPDIPGDDVTVPNSDSAGDACDNDADNDILLDADELTGAACGGVITEVSTDVAYGDGDGTSWDTDGDVVPDGVECVLGTSPVVNSFDHRNTCNSSQADGDDDSDGLQNDWETCGWKSSPSVIDSDGDGLCDALEAMDVNGNGVVTNGDAVFIQQHTLGIIVGDAAAMDINRNGVITNGDRIFVIQAIGDLFPNCLP
jgi:hypothetical protein